VEVELAWVHRSERLAPELVVELALAVLAVELLQEQILLLAVKELEQEQVSMREEVKER